MPLSLITAATAEPLTWATVQKQIRQDGSDDDAESVTNQIIPAVRERGELATRRAFVGPQTWDYILDGFPPDGFIEIPKPPLIDVLFVKYVDTQGVTQTWASSSYLVQAPAGPRCRRGRVALPFASVWPVTLRQMGAVTVRFRCGYQGTDSDPAAGLPPLLISAMLTDCGRLYEQRESLIVDARVAAVEVPGSARDIYRAFRSVATQRLE
jgi:uncharacterized phiE125 gp8 family phage protein